MLRRDSPQWAAQRSIRPRKRSSTEARYARSIAGQLIGDRVKRPLKVEVEAEGLFPRRTICGGRFSGSIVEPGVVTVGCSIRCSSSRTFPGQSYRDNREIA